jgi:hypothetical protein
VVRTTLRTQIVLGRKDEADDQTDQLLLPPRQLGAVAVARGWGYDVDPDRLMLVICMSCEEGRGVCVEECVEECGV